MGKLKRCSYCLFCCITMPALAQPSLTVGAFSSGSLKDWDSHSFKGETLYTLVIDTPHIQVLQAESQANASGLVHKQRIDLIRTPYLNWRWKVGNLLSPQVQEKTKGGDDYAARLYVLIDGGLLFWQTKSINYVWASNSPKNSSWRNAYAGDAVMMLALRDRRDPLNVWQTEKRNVREDFKRLLGLDVKTIDAVALMTDTDNSGESATAFYGDISFSAD